jgi:exopolysaccharide production protein ExoZ
LVLYAFLPIIFLIARKGIRAFNVLLLFFAIIYFAFAFKFIDSSSTLSEQWYLYTNPMNQAFLFVSGYAIGVFRKTKVLQNKGYTLVGLVGFLLFMFFFQLKEINCNWSMALLP